MILSTCCTPEENRIWAAAQGHGNQLARDQPEHFVMGGDAVSNQDPHWDYNSPKEPRDPMCIRRNEKVYQEAS